MPVRSRAAHAARRNNYTGPSLHGFHTSSGDAMLCAKPKGYGRGAEPSSTHYSPGSCCGCGPVCFVTVTSLHAPWCRVRHAEAQRTLTGGGRHCLAAAEHAHW